VPNHPFLDQLDLSLSGVIPAEPVDLRGEWSQASRRTYKSDAQSGTGSGPFVEVVDLRWRGALTCDTAISGIAFLAVADTLYWVKASEASPSLAVGVSLHAYPEYTDRGATFAARLADTSLPGVPVPGSANLIEACLVQPGMFTTGRVARVARASSASFFVLLMQRSCVRMGRKRLWRLREEFAASLPDAARQLLTHRRTGTVHLGSGGSGHAAE
jgi:hypothetical protein